MNNPLGVSRSEGNQGTTQGKEKIFWPRWESTHDHWIRSTITLLTEQRGRTEKVGTIKVVNRGEEKVRVMSVMVMSELILCSTICVHTLYSKMAAILVFFCLLAN